MAASSRYEEANIMGIMKKFFNQTRKPEGTLGKLMLSSMNSGHAKLADWGFSHLPELRPERIVELGCGAGRNAGELLKKYPQAHVTAIDYSPLSVEKAGEYNREPDACFLICNESDGLDATGKKFEKIIDGMKVYTAEELEAALRKAGFTEVYTDRYGSKPWITVLARK